MTFTSFFPPMHKICDAHLHCHLPKIPSVQLFNFRKTHLFSKLIVWGEWLLLNGAAAPKDPLVTAAETMTILHVRSPPRFCEILISPERAPCFLFPYQPPECR